MHAKTDLFYYQSQTSKKGGNGNEQVHQNIDCGAFKLPSNVKLRISQKIVEVLGQ